MVSTFYKNYSKNILWIVALSFPFLAVQAGRLPSNNDIETWLPIESDVRSTYEQFKEEFGAEEVILIGMSHRRPEDPLVEAVCRRIEKLPGIRQCWSPERLRTMMENLDVSESEIEQRLKGLAVSDDGTLIGLVALLSKQGLADRAGTVAGIRGELRYCQLSDEEVSLAGSPVVVAELDRLGSRKGNKRFFLITLFISLCLLYYAIRQWNLTLSILGLTVWAIQLNLAMVKLAGGEMNFIMGALSVMVMVFTLAASIHFFHYYRASLAEDDPLGKAFRLAWKPCCLATLTTTIGLISLTVSNIAPVSQFGYAAALGSLAALLTGLGLTPAVLTVWPYRPRHTGQTFAHRLSRVANWLLDHSKPVALVSAVLVVVTSLGLLRLESKIDPLDFLPKDGKVLADVRRIERDLTSSSSIEAVVDFGNREMPFLDKLQEVRSLEACIRKHPAVRHTMSAASFFPTELPEDALSVMGLLKRANSQQGNNGFVADGERLWRISARVRGDCGFTRQETLDDLVAATRGASTSISFTGIAPLLESAQREIFNGFWESFALAFVIITVVMIVSLWSLKTGLVAMIPNLTPLCIVFGILGWIGFPVDIGMMMTGSIALGIAVDGTFHYLVRYEERYRRTNNSPRAARFALLQTGTPIFEAGAIAAIGMLALTLSQFTPTARFGYMMATLLVAALVGDLVLLPALLYLRPAPSSAGTDDPGADDDETNLPPKPPHFATHKERKAEPEVDSPSAIPLAYKPEQEQRD